jgi:hypothetical protein
MYRPTFAVSEISAFVTNCVLLTSLFTDCIVL